MEDIDMFLNELNEKQAVAFINLVTEFALSDHDIGKEEEVLMEKFCEEMGLSEEVIVEMDEDEAYKVIEGSSDRITNIMYFELLRIGLVDDDYDFKEVDFIEKFGDKMGIPRAKRMAIVNYFYKFPDAEPKNMEEAISEAEELLR